MIEEKDETLAFSEEIYEKIKISQDVKKKIYTKIGKNILMAIIISIYMIFLNLGHMKLDENIFKNDLKVFAFSLILFTIWIFEKAYKKDSGSYTIFGIEMLVLSCITLYMPMVYYYQGNLIKVIFEMSAVYISIYYCVKSIIVYKREIKKFKNSLSDVKEIVKKDDTYIDKKSEKKFSKQKGEN